MDAVVDARHTDPRLIPLPPSPAPRKPQLPSRRPIGWISTLPERVLPSASLSSAPDDRAASGARQVSETLLRAVAPHRSPRSASAGGMDESDPYIADKSAEASEASEGDGDTSVRVIDSSFEDANGSEQDEFDRADLSAQVAALTDQERDEVWMSYVRTQLSALFPDLSASEPIADLGFEPDYDAPPGLISGAADPQQRSVSGSTIESAPIRTPRSSSGMNGHAPPTQPIDEDATAQQARDEGELVRLTGVPGMRSEIEGLREEIERLRGMVGGLADGLRRPGADADDGPVAVEPVQPMAAPHDLPGEQLSRQTGPPEIPAIAMETILQSLDLVRLLDAVLGARRAPLDTARADNDIFCPANLELLAAKVRSLIVS